MSWLEDDYALLADDNTDRITRLTRKVRYKSASLGVPLTENERKIGSWRNRYRGQRAFLLGNGPSIVNQDLSLLKEEITFGVNAIYLHKERMGFLPTHYLVEDTLVAEDRRDEIIALNGPNIWLGNYLKYCLSDVDAYWLNVLIDYRDYQGFPHFSPNLERLVWVGGTVTYLAMQLAYFMGIQTLYLLGFDHQYQIPESGLVQGDLIISTDSDPNHFHPDYFGKGYRWHFPKTERMEQAYIKARTIYNRSGRRIINASEGGHLEVFPRQDYVTVLREQDT